MGNSYLVMVGDAKISGTAVGTQELRRGLAGMERNSMPWRESVNLRHKSFATMKNLLPVNI